MDELYTQLVERASKNSQEIRAIHEILDRHEDRIEKLQETTNVITKLTYILEESRQTSEKITETLNNITATLTTMNISIQKTDEKVQELSRDQEQICDEVNAVNKRISEVDQKSVFDWMDMVKKSLIPSLLTGGVIYLFMNLPK